MPWVELARAPVPGGAGELSLHRRGGEYSIRLASGGELMNSRLHGSEEALASLACARLSSRAAPRVLVGGLGMGFTLAAALAALPPNASVTVAELVPAVIEWNRGELGACAGHPLRDPRVQAVAADVRELIGAARRSYDAILLDVDNGPGGLTSAANDDLYSPVGLAAARRALSAGGVLAVWSAHPDAAFQDR
ncbi:MAG TPA: hypothetical protein VNT60_09860, partial [Deinococcales bacterium]|nr:hypothetical protein [Deinococcales bacterium]